MTGTIDNLLPTAARHVLDHLCVCAFNNEPVWVRELRILQEAYEARTKAEVANRSAHRAPEDFGVGFSLLSVFVYDSYSDYERDGGWFTSVPNLQPVVRARAEKIWAAGKADLVSALSLGAATGYLSRLLGHRPNAWAVLPKRSQRLFRTTDGRRLASLFEGDPVVETPSWRITCVDRSLWDDRPEEHTPKIMAPRPGTAPEVLTLALETWDGKDVQDLGRLIASVTHAVR